MEVRLCSMARVIQPQTDTPASACLAAGEVDSLKIPKVYDYSEFLICKIFSAR